MKYLRYSLAFTAMATVCLMAVHPASTQTNSPKQFVAPQQLGGPVGDLIGVGDLNGDGRPDIVSTNNIQIATGPGTFRYIVPTNEYVTGSKLFDVNGDGKLDIVEPVPADETCDYDPHGFWFCWVGSYSALRVSLGKGDGSFQAPYRLDLGDQGSGTGTLAMADVNGDGSLDAVVSFSGVENDSSSFLNVVLLNDGTGHFELDRFANIPRVFAVGDLNGDGKVDLIVGAQLGVLYGNGDGTFIAGQSFNNIVPHSVVIADFNQDGRPDAAAADGSKIYLLWGQANGTFASPQTIATFTALSLQAVDLNYDGYPELVAGYGSFAVYTNLRNGTFSNPKVYAGAVFDKSFGFGNFNNDQYLDLVWGNHIAYGSYAAGFLAPQLTHPANTAYATTADFDGDHIDDAAVTSYSNPNLQIFPGTGKGYFNPPVTYSTGITNGMVTTGDVNGDGIADLVVVRTFSYTPITGANDVSVLFGNGDGTFQTAISSKILGDSVSFVPYATFYAIDINHDGKADLIGDWGVALGHGNGTFSAPTPFPSPIPKLFAGFAVGDFNRDGHPDILVGVYSPAAVYTLLGDGNGGFTLSNSEKLNYTHPYLNSLITADMNGDGIPDLLYEYSATPSAGSYDRVVVELGDGAGNFGNATGTRITYIGAGAYDQLLAGDFDQDGKPDVVVLSNSYLTLSQSAYLRGNGTGELSTPQYFYVHGWSGNVLDLNGDGAPDIVAQEGSGLERCLNTGIQN